MKVSRVKKPENGFAFLEIILVAMVILFLSYIALKTYFKNPPSIDKPTQEFLSGQGIDTSSQQSVLDSTKEKIKDLNKQMLDSEKQLEDYR